MRVKGTGDASQKSTSMENPGEERIGDPGENSRGNVVELCEKLEWAIDTEGENIRSTRLQLLAGGSGGEDLQGII